MAMNPGYVEEEITGIPTFEPSYHLPAIWITESYIGKRDNAVTELKLDKIHMQKRCDILGSAYLLGACFPPPSIIATHLTQVISAHLDELLTRQDVQNLINNMQEANQTLIGELVPKLLGVGEIQKVLQNLLREGISILDLVTIDGLHNLLGPIRVKG